jgi:cell wall-associated NlpC family hydrolase
LPVVNSSGVVSEGDLVFYTRPKKSYPAHVAVYVGNDEVISLWTAPKGINSVQRIPIDSFPGTTIQYGPKPW